MKTIEKILDVEIITNNEREITLVRIINQKIDMCINWKKTNRFEHRTSKVIYEEIENINTLFSSLYYMGLTSESSILTNLYDFIFGKEI